MVGGGEVKWCVNCLLQTLPALGPDRRVVTVILLNECRMEVMVEVGLAWCTCRGATTNHVLGLVWSRLHLSLAFHCAA